MKVNRAKMIRKYLRFFKILYGINPPYHILLDGNFIFSALKNNINIADRLKSLLQGEVVRFWILKSSMDELKSVGAKGEKSLQFCNEFCTLINDDKINGSTAFDKLIGFIATCNKTSDTSGAKHHERRYFVCTQDRELRALVGSIPGYPLIYLNQVTLVMEPPSSASKEFQKKVEIDKTRLNVSEESILQSLGITSLAPQSEALASEPKPERKKRKATEPNPLAVQPASDTSNRSKRKKLNAIKRSHT